MCAVLLMCLGIFFKQANSIVTGNTPDFAVRLNNSFGNSSTEGRLEIYYNGSWGTVCGDSFTFASAKVACASLGYGYGEVIGNRYGAGTGQIWLDDVSCTGAESGIEQCPHNPWGVHNCGHSEDVSISCAILCGKSYISGPTGTISSPKFPMAHVYNVDCYNYISVSPGYAVVLQFSTFDPAPCCNWVTITCESGKAIEPFRYSGKFVPPYLTISSCQRVKVAFHIDVSYIRTDFSLTYNITSDIFIGGITTKPSNAFPNSDKDERVIFNCTSATNSLPWWTINGKEIRNDTVTNSSCGVIIPMPYGSWFVTETLGPGSCNLIVVAPGCELYRLTGSLACTDSTLASARALLVPINLELNITNGMNSSSSITSVVRDEEARISCTSSFIGQYSSTSFVFSFAIYYGGPPVQILILRTYWTSQGNVVSSINTSEASSYVLLKAVTDIIPPYTCNIVFDFFSNISSISGGYPLEISYSTDPINVLYWPTEENMTIIGHSNGQILSSSLLFCYVPTNPPATYQWIDESRSYIINGSTITIIHGGEYTCKASNFIRGKYYQQSKSISIEVVEDDSHQLEILAIILGSLLGGAVLIIIILAILLICKCRQQKTTTTADDGHITHGNEHELQQRGNSNHYEASLNDVEMEYEHLNDSRRPLPTIQAIYQELTNRT